MGCTRLIDGLRYPLSLCWATPNHAEKSVGMFNKGYPLDNSLRDILSSDKITSLNNWI